MEYSPNVVLMQPTVLDVHGVKRNQLHNSTNNVVLYEIVRPDITNISLLYCIGNSVVVQICNLVQLPRSCT